MTVDSDCNHKIKRHFLLGRKAMTNLDSVLKIRDITLPTNVHIVKAMVFPIVMYGCESWTIKKTEHQRIDVFELWCWRRLLSVPWTTRRSKPVSPKGNRLWIFFGRNDAEAPILWPPDSKNWLLGKDPDAGKDWRPEEKGTAEDEMVGWHYWLNGHEFEPTPGDKWRTGKPGVLQSTSYKEMDTTEQQMFQKPDYFQTLGFLPWIVLREYFKVSFQGFIFCKHIQIPSPLAVLFWRWMANNMLGLEVLFPLECSFFSSGNKTICRDLEIMSFLGGRRCVLPKVLLLF